MLSGPFQVSYIFQLLRFNSLFQIVSQSLSGIKCRLRSRNISSSHADGLPRCCGGFPPPFSCRKTRPLLFLGGVQITQITRRCGLTFPNTTRNSLVYLVLQLDQVLEQHNNLHQLHQLSYHDSLFHMQWSVLSMLIYTSNFLQKTKQNKTHTLQ